MRNNVISYRQQFGQSVFGPGTDLIISLVAVLVMVTALYKAIEEIRIGKIRKHQVEMVNSLAGNSIINGDILTEYRDYHKINENVTVRHQAYSQTFTFGQDILFPSGEISLNDKSKSILLEFGDEISHNINRLSEIQINGHADTIPPADFRSNIVLAFERSNLVFEFLSQATKIDPNEIRMSVTSYGEFLPVKRRENESIEWNRKKIINENNSSDKRGLNRRIEIVLSYKK